MISATEFVCTFRRSPGSALFKCSDGQFYILTFRELTSRSASLCTKFLTSKLARLVGLPTPDVEIIELDQSLIDHSPELRTQIPELQTLDDGIQDVQCDLRSRKRGGLQLGSCYLVRPGEGTLFDFFPEKMLSRVANLKTFAGALVFDLWMKNVGVRRAVFYRSSHETQYNVAFLCQGWVPQRRHPFGCAFDPARVAMYRNKAVYRNIAEWNDFEPFLSRLEAIDIGTMEDFVGEIPQNWCDNRSGMVARLIELHERQAVVRDLVSEFLVDNHKIFPNWRGAQAVPAVAGEGASLTASTWCPNWPSCEVN